MLRSIDLQHMLDVIFYEKNLSQNVIKIIFGAKDTLMVQEDLE